MMIGLRRLARDLGGIAVVIGLMLLVTRLPPDTSLDQIEATGAIRACVPTTYPPLVTGIPERPGIDIELLRVVADRMGVALILSPVDAMGRDFNPRNWAVSRGKCQVLAGGVVNSPLTRSFLDTGPPYAETGWAILAPRPLDGIDGRPLGVLTLVSGLDRIGLARTLRRHEVRTQIMRSGETLVEDIASGALDGGITEELLARELSAGRGWWVAPVPDQTRYRLVFGLWKGDLTLKREISRVFRQIEADGTLDAILSRYGALPLRQSVSLGRP